MTLRRRVRTPTVLQMEAVECGAAALCIVLAHHGRVVPLPVLRRQCGVSRGGSKASNLVKVAREYGLTAKGLKREVDKLADLPLPFVVFWTFNHFLVVEGFTPERVLLNDPACGPRSVSKEEFGDCFTGVALTFEPTPAFTRGGRFPTLPEALARRLDGSWREVGYCAAAGALNGVPLIAGAFFGQLFIDHILVARRPDWLIPLLLAMALTVALGVLTTRLQLRALRRLGGRLALLHTDRFVHHLLALPASFYVQRYAGEVADRVRLNQKVADVVTGPLGRAATDVTVLALLAVTMLAYDLALTAVVVGSAAASFWALRRLTLQVADETRRVSLELGKGAGVVVGGLRGIETIKAAAAEDSIFQRWAGHYTKALGDQQRVSVAAARLAVLPELSHALVSLLVVVLGGLRVLDGQLTIGGLAAFLLLVNRFDAPIEGLARLALTIQELRGDLGRLDDVLDNPPAPAPAPTAEAPSGLDGRVELDGVRFAYSSVDPPIVEGFSLRVAPGHVVALVGASGSGKSTVGRLLAGLYEPDEGRILYDGVPRGAHRPEVLSDGVALVEQEVLLFAGTVLDNLTLWDETLPREQVVRACEDAAIHEAILGLPGGYGAELLEGGANLSGGQRQRLELARALVREPRVLILDEATSALDAETEAVVVRNLRRRGCTCVVVAHRLSTIRGADEIIVLERGKIAQRGTHEALSARPGPYRRLLEAEPAPAGAA